MPRIGVTGHMNLTAATRSLVYESIMAELASLADSADLTGISCIARGADSIFATAILDSGGKLEVVLPVANYRQLKVAPEDADEFDSLLGRASKVHIGPGETADRAAYAAANETLLGRSETLFAVWDGQEGIDKGSTASVVKLAHERGLDVTIIWPSGAARG